MGFRGAIFDEDAANIADALERACNEEAKAGDEGLPREFIDYLREFNPYCRGNKAHGQALPFGLQMLTVTNNRRSPAGRVSLSAVYARADSLHRGGRRAGESEVDFSPTSRRRKPGHRPDGTFILEVVS
jgi:hypothetical protein